MRKGIINQALMKITLYVTEMMDYYLIFFDQELKENANEDGHDIALKNIPPFDILKNYLVALPPLNEQHRICARCKDLLSYIDIIKESLIQGSLRLIE